MFYAIGLGLADEKDVSVKGLEIIKRAERVYLEAYTAVLLVEKEVLVRNLAIPLGRTSEQALIAIAVGSLLWPQSNHRRP
jgi:diphthamide biosynthesis methyltransferase